MRAKIRSHHIYSWDPHSYMISVNGVTSRQDITDLNK